MIPTPAVRRLPSLLALGVAAVGMLAAPLLMPAAAHAEEQPFGGNVAYDWEIPNAPKSGMTRLVMPMTINPESAHIDGTYVATQFNFTGAEDVGYMGLQPRPDQDGQTRLHGVFSSFIPGTTSTDPQCTDGADGGAGVGCANDFDAVAGRTYDLEVKKSGADTWTGTAIDTVTGQRHHIGTYTLPQHSGKLKNSQVGFVENYWNHSRTCEGVQRIDTTIGRPRTNGHEGSASNPREYGDCLVEANYAATSTDGTVQITRGWA